MNEFIEQESLENIDEISTNVLEDNTSLEHTENIVLDLSNAHHEKLIVEQNKDMLLQEENVVQETVDDKLSNEFIVIDKLEEIHKSVESLSKLFSKKIAYNEQQEKIVDNMHTELQKYKNDMYSSMMKPIFQDIIEVVDSIRKTGIAFANKGESEKQAAKIITDYINDLHNILDKYNVESYSANVGDDYKAIKQKIVKSINIEKLEMNGKIAESLGYGYLYNEKVLSAEKVKVYKYVESIIEEELREE